jgi:hypothetical protein
MKISKTLTLLAAVAAVTTASAELPTRSEREFYVAPGTKRQTYRNTQEIRTINSDRRQRETEAMGGEFKAVVERVQLGLEAKFGNAAEALKHPDAIKYDSYLYATQFVRKYNKSDSASYVYEMQEYITTALQDKAISSQEKAVAMQERTITVAKRTAALAASSDTTLANNN